MNVIVSANRSLVKERSGINKGNREVACISSSTERKEQL